MFDLQFSLAALFNVVLAGLIGGLLTLLVGYLSTRTLRREMRSTLYRLRPLLKQLGGEIFTPVFEKDGKLKGFGVDVPPEAARTRTWAKPLTVQIGCDEE